MKAVGRVSFGFVTDPPQSAGRPVIKKSLKHVSVKGFCLGIESIMVRIFRKGYLKAMFESMTFGHDYYEKLR
ncbi:hypothetical protein [Porticoccus sp.]|uniref:hypothetical protein n=1 Tax=Porticoccus sp. TaxID=2024853 RepID=UPI003F69D442